MKKFIVDPSFWALFPEAKIGVLLIKDMEAGEESPEALQSLLAESNEKAKSYLTAGVFSENPVIAVYREAFKQFKTKKGARSSIEALLKRASKDNPVPSINPLVDIYNAASLRFALPFGAEDMDTFEGDLRLTITEGDDAFYPIGDGENQPTLPGELCYKDDAGAVCRCFNWRDGQRTMITEGTKNAFLISELVDPSREDALEEALQFVEDQLGAYLSGKVEKVILDKDNPSLVLED